MKNQILILAFIFFIVAINAQQKGVSQLPTANRQLNTSSYAVVVGISDYQDPVIPDLQFADKDALAFANYLRSATGGSLDADHLKVLINSQATMAQFANVLDWLMEIAKEGDQAIIYFSGHGDVEKKTFSQPGFLLCWDSPPRVYMAGGAFALPMLQEVISTLSIQNKVKVLMITDACRSGKLAGSSVGGAQITGSNLAKQYANEIKILSCQPNEYSIEGTQWGGGRGVFSYHLIDALYGMADSNGDQWVTLQEVSRYLEDHVSTEVAPVSQVPMTIGNRTERLANVDPSLLATIQSGKTNQMALLTSIDSRGYEDEILANVDTAIREKYILFKQALKDKILLDSTAICAEAYYNKLIAEPKLARLHSSMRRNFAAALQDDAQQAINIWLKADIIQLACIGRSLKLEPIPRQLEKAAELLGDQHYMYKALKGRQYLFEAYLLHQANFSNLDSAKRSFDLLQRSKYYEPNSPLLYYNLMIIYGFEFRQMDSSKVYLEIVHKMLPGWVLPFNDFYWILVNNSKPGIDTIEKTIIDRALSIDSTHGFILGALANWLSNQQRIEEAIEVSKQYELHGGAIYPCWFYNFANLYLLIGKKQEAISIYFRAIHLDSTQAEENVMNIAMLYRIMGEFDKAEQALVEYSPLHKNAWEYLYFKGRFLVDHGLYKEAIPYFEKVIEKKPLYVSFRVGANAELLLGEIFLKLGRKTEARKLFYKTIAACRTIFDPLYLNYTGRAYLDLGKLDSMQTIIRLTNEMKPANGQYEYQYACLNALAGFNEEAVHWLEQAFQHGNKEITFIVDWDMDSLRNTEVMNKFLKKYYPHMGDF